jgi:hypothetical protein
MAGATLSEMLISPITDLTPTLEQMSPATTRTALSGLAHR